jgi:hypothetical protein
MGRISIFLVLVALGTRLGSAESTATAGPQTFPMKLVSAAEATILDRDLARQLNLDHGESVAGRKFANLDAAVDPNPSASDVNIGVSLPRHFLITTDFSQHAVWLEPRK